MFSLPDLVALLAVEETKSVRLAAARVHKTQSAVSQAIQRIEASAGFAILDRTAYRATLTEQGRQFVKRARPLLRHSEELATFAKVIAQGVEERVGLAVHGAIPCSVWSGLLTNVARNYPDTVIEVRSGEGDRPFRALMEGEVDLALLLSPPSDRLALPLEARKYGSMAFVQVVRDDAVCDGDEEAALCRLPQILAADFEDKADPSFGVAEGHRYWRVSNHIAKAELILQGLGWGGVPEALVEGALAAGMLRHIARACTSRKSVRSSYLYIRPDRPLGPVATAIWQAAAVQVRKSKRRRHDQYDDASP
jgi:DNA-binding transcriptional LysR family regulator